MSSTCPPTPRSLKKSYTPAHTTERTSYIVRQNNHRQKRRHTIQIDRHRQSAKISDRSRYTDRQVDKETNRKNRLTHMDRLIDYTKKVYTTKCLSG